MAKYRILHIPSGEFVADNTKQIDVGLMGDTMCYCAAPVDYNNITEAVMYLVKLFSGLADSRHVYLTAFSGTSYNEGKQFYISGPEEFEIMEYIEERKLVNA